MTDEMFADGIERITTQAGVVRIDFVSVSPAEEGRPAEVQNRQRVIMSLQGFVKAFGTLQEMLQQLAASGTITIKPVASAGSVDVLSKKPGTVQSD